MRVLFSSTSGIGHNLPMVPLARAFRDAGHDVLWATSAEACALVETAGLDATAAGLSGPELRERVGRLQAAAREVAPVDRAAFMFPAMFGELLTPPMVAALLTVARDWRPELMVHEHGELASPLVGAVLGTPSLTHAFGGAIPVAIVEAAAERVTPLWVAQGLEPPPYGGAFTAPYLDICPASVQSVPMDHIPTVQPLRPVSDAAEPEMGHPDHLDQDGRPLVYVTLGTVQNHAPILRDLVLALSRLPLSVLVTVGPDRDPASLGELPANVRVESWVDQAEVLRHCAVVVSHAGSGTFLGALAAGRPQLCLPQAADQFRNAAGGARSGAALVLPPIGTTDEAVTRAVSRLLDEDTFREAARTVAREIAAMPSPAEVVATLASAYA